MGIRASRLKGAPSGMSACGCAARARCGGLTASLRPSWQRRSRALLTMGPCRVRIPALDSKKPRYRWVSGLQTLRVPPAGCPRAAAPPALAAEAWRPPCDPCWQRRSRALLTMGPCRVRIPALDSKKPRYRWVSGLQTLRVPPAGFEPAISTLKGWRPGPLDDGDRLAQYNRHIALGIVRERGPAIIRWHPHGRHLSPHPAPRQTAPPNSAQSASRRASCAGAARGWCACGSSRRTGRSRRTPPHR